MKRLKKYLIITFIITWALWIGDAILVKYTAYKESDFLPQALLIMGGFGPTIAAICCMEQKRNLKNILKFIFSNKRASVLVLLLLITMEILVFGLSSMELNKAIALATIPIVFLKQVTIYGGNEELGWRGIMQPILQTKLPYPIATLIVGCVWSVWHTPLWFIEGNSHQSASFMAFALLAVLMAYWLSAIINSGGSVFWCMILHGVTNTLMTVLVIKVNFILILGWLLLLVAAVYISMRNISHTKSAGCRQ